tara:strand:+ start:325 stop:654 length:330 start_codon:yes stop_codon:yes gene_type:complete
MAPNLEIIKKRSTFLYIKNKGKFLSGECFNINYLKNSNLENAICIGYIASKKLGNAVKRNKAKRILRELGRKVVLKYGKINFYYVLIAKNSIFNTKMSEQENQLKELIT